MESEFGSSGNEIARLAEAIQSGRVVVPLLGAGLSSEAGVPSSVQLTAYFSHVAKQLSLRGELENSPRSSVLQRLGWPDLYDVRGQILSSESAASSRHVLTSTRADFLKETGVTDAEKADWRTLLRRLTDGKRTLIDSFYDKIILPRRPAFPHQQLSLLASTLGWRLILTTNSDTLLEDCIAGRGMSYATREIAISGSFPAAELIADENVILKLHGGREELAAGEYLDFPFEQKDVGTFVNYFTDPPVFLILGYSGSDRRVRQLVAQVTKDDDLFADEAGLRLVWVYRRRPPQQLIDCASKLGKGKVLFLKAGSAGRVLQELYCRLSSSHSPVRSFTREISGLPPFCLERSSVGSESEGATGSQPNGDHSVAFFLGEESGAGTSSELASYAERHLSTHQIVWIDLEEVPTVSSLVSLLLRELKYSDKGLAPLLPLAMPKFDIKDAASSLGLQPAVEKITEALSRGAYLVAIDSVAEFGRAQWGHDNSTPSPWIENRAEHLYAFLRELVDQSGAFGESKVAVALTPIDLRGGAITEEQPTPRIPIVRLADTNTLYGTSSSIPGSSLFGENEDSDAPPSRTADTPAILNSESTVVFVPSHSADSSDDDLPEPAERGRSMIPEDHPVWHSEAYRLIRMLGAGGFGEVWLAQDTALRRNVAIKIAWRDDPRDRGDAIEEARAAARLRHPNIVVVHGLVEYGAPWAPLIVMPFLGGRTLEDRMDDYTGNLQSAVRLLILIAEAIQHAHANSISHRDIKPRNILFDEHGIPFVSDFGLSRFVFQRDNADRAAGTPMYMAPEQFGHEGADDVLDEWGLTQIGFGVTVDVYSFGVLMFRLLTGSVPFSEDRLALIDQKLNHATPKASDLDPKLPDELVEVCWKCMDTKPQDRFPNMRSVANRLLDWLESNQKSSRRFGLIESPAKGSESGRQLQSALNVMHRKMRKELKQHYVESEVVLVRECNSGGDFVSATSSKAISRVIEGGDIDRIAEEIEGDVQGDTLLAAIQHCWGQLAPPYKKILTVASLFRKPRSLVAFRRFSEFICSEEQDVHQEGDQREFLSSAPDDAQNNRNMRIDLWLDELSRIGFLVRQEGGYFWMHRDIRDWIFDQVTEHAPREISNLHAAISDYYYEDVYWPERTLNAFQECVFHAVWSLHMAAPLDRRDRVQSLLSRVQREQQNVVNGAHVGAVVEAIRDIRDYALTKLFDGEIQRAENAPGIIVHKETASLIGELMWKLTDIEAEVLQLAEKHEMAVQVRISQIVALCQKASIDERKAIPKRPDHSAEGISTWLSETLGRLSEPQTIRTCDPEVFASILEQTLQIAISVQELVHGRKPARAIFSAVSDAACDLANVDANGNHSDPCTLIRLRCALWKASSLLDDVHIWSRVERKSLEAVRECCAEAELLITTYRCSTKEFARFSSILKQLKSRLYYLGSDFQRFSQMLDQAKNFVATIEDRESLQIKCDLRHCEGLLLQSSAVIKGTQITSHRKANGCLRGATTAISRVRRRMPTTASVSKLWLSVFYLEAQLAHEKLLLLMHSVDCGCSSRIDRLVVDQLVVSGLVSIRAGMDNVSNTAHRCRRFEVLWWQYLVLILLIGLEERVESPALDRFLGLNRRAKIHSRLLEMLSIPLKQIATEWERLQSEYFESMGTDTGLRSTALWFQEKLLCGGPQCDELQGAFTESWNVIRRAAPILPGPAD